MPISIRKVFYLVPTTNACTSYYVFCDNIHFAKASGGLAGLQLGGDLQAAGLGHVQLLPQANIVYSNNQLLAVNPY
jgi:hypothetical protein